MCRVCKVLAAAVVVPALVFSSCSTDSYEEGTGAYSLTRADFVEVHSASAGTADYVLTDEGETLVLSSPQSVSWLAKADTLYRAVLYYNLLADGKAEAVSLSSIPVLTPRTLEEMEEQAAADPSKTFVMHTDPVKFESLWLSSSGKYLNIGFYMKSGQIDDGAELHTIGMIDDGITDNPDGTRTAFMRLYHDQGDVPEYYSSKFYVSLLSSAIDADSVAITINTYDGPIERRVRVMKNLLNEE